MSTVRPRTGGFAMVQALATVTILTVAALIVMQTAHLVNAASGYDACRRQAQDLIAARAEAWKAGSVLAVETGTLASGAAYRLTPEVATSNGVDQLRMEIIWSLAEPLPGSSADWPDRTTAIATRLP